MYSRIETELSALPENNWFTKEYCTRFSGTLIVDGKYVKVKGYKQKIPFIYGIDYESHDIVVSMLAPSENEEAFLKFFRLVKAVGYPLKTVVTDDRSSLVFAMQNHFPYAQRQLCQNHYLENLRVLLHIRTESAHQSFFHDLERRVFKTNVPLKVRNLRLHELMVKHGKQNVVYQSLLMDIYHRRHELFLYTHIPNCPKDTNLIELFNSHLQSRLKSVKGFQTFESAARFLNAYVLRRRTLPFTDCEGKFKYLNGHMSLEFTIKKQASLPEILIKYQLKSER